MATFKWSDIDAAAKEAWKGDLDRVMAELDTELGGDWALKLMKALVEEPGKEEP